jgi:hypothetical protein
VKIKSIAKTGESLLQPTIKVGFSKLNVFDFEIGDIFNIYGILALENQWSYLLSKEKDETPSWYPAELFEVVDHTLPPIFYFDIRVRKNEDGEKCIMAFWGYKEMVLDYSYHDDLIESERQALNIFFKRKEEIDEYEELRANNLEISK